MCSLTLTAEKKLINERRGGLIRPFLHSLFLFSIPLLHCIPSIPTLFLHSHAPLLLAYIPSSSYPLTTLQPTNQPTNKQQTKNDRNILARLWRRKRPESGQRRQETRPRHHLRQGPLRHPQSRRTSSFFFIAAVFFVFFFVCSELVFIIFYLIDIHLSASAFCSCLFRSGIFFFWYFTAKLLIAGSATWNPTYT